MSFPSSLVQSGWNMILVPVCNGAMPLRCRQLQLTTLQASATAAPTPSSALYLGTRTSYWRLALHSLGAVALTAKGAYQFHHVCPSVRPHVSARFPLQGFSLNLINESFKRMLRKSKFCWNWTKLPGTLHEALTRYVFTVSSSTIYFVARQQNKRNPLVRFHSDTKHFYVAKRNM
jgi:hypothetical protein